MALHVAAAAGLPEAGGDLKLCLGIEADALGLAGGAGGVGDFPRAARHLGHRCLLALQQSGRGWYEAATTGQLICRTEQAIDACVIQHMLLLCRGEEAR
ncbi:hypothetical protein D3C71_1672900 [compost metagenome]